MPELAADSRLPAWSTTVMLLFDSSGTLLEIRWTMALTWPSSMLRPRCNDSTTDALGFFCSRTNSEGLGSARWTRADSTAEIELIERASSPSSARW